MDYALVIDYVVGSGVWKTQNKKIKNFNNI